MIPVVIPMPAPGPPTSLAVAVVQAIGGLVLVVLGLYYLVRDLGGW